MSSSVKPNVPRRAPTKRQRAVLRLIAQGHDTPKKLALKLGIGHSNACNMINRMVVRNLVRKNTLEIIG